MNVLCTCVLLASSSAAANPLVISEFRLRGPNGASDEFIEIHNITNSPVTVQTTDGSSGYAVAASDGVARFIIPNGTVVPARGYFLGVNSVGYSLASYPAGNGTTATGDATYTTDILDNAGIALFNTSTPASFTLANRLDAVGSTAEANTLYKEGTGYSALTPFSIDYSFARKHPGSGSTNAIDCASAGSMVDTDTNASDFSFYDTNGTSAGAGQRLGTPGPQNLSSPPTPIAAVTSSSWGLIDVDRGENEAPNVVRNFTSDPANNSTFGTISIRRKFTNTTGGNITRLRFRIQDLSTFPAPSGYADLRPRTASTASVGLSSGANVTVVGLTLEQPPSQPNGSGYNGTLSAGTVTLGAPLANGASINVNFLLGIQQTGVFKFAVTGEALPSGGGFTSMVGSTESGDLVECTLNPPEHKLIISEFRLRGPNGASDEFVEIYNNSDRTEFVKPSDGSSGFSLVASDGTARFTIPENTFIRARGYFLGANSVGYSLSSTPAGEGSTASAQVTYTTNIADNAGIALFKTSSPGNFTLANRLDAVGSTSEANTLYKEGTGYSALTPFSIDYSFTRRYPGTAGSAPGSCFATIQGAAPQDTGDNASDLLFVDTNGTSAGAGQRLGTPGPQNNNSPKHGVAATIAYTNSQRLDPAVATGASPNLARSLTSDPANNSTFGTVDIRRTFRNETGRPITRLKFRVVDISTFPSPSGTADLRPRNSSDLVVSTSGGNQTVRGTTLEQPPSQPNGGGFNSVYLVNGVTNTSPLAAGATIHVRFLIGVQQTGNYRFFVQEEATPLSRGYTWGVIASTDNTSALDCGLRSTSTVVGSSQNPSSPGASVTFTATVTSSGSTPTGTVTFFDGASPLGSDTLDGAGEATLSTSALTGGSHSITAVYAGDDEHQSSTSSVVSQTVLQATTTSLSPAPSPSDPGQQVTLTATVSAGVGTPTGTVTFFDGPTNLGTASLSSGTATLDTSSLTEGSHALTASYGGDSSYEASTSSAVDHTVRHTTTTSLSAAPNPSNPGQQVTLTATVNAGVGTPTGTVTFFDGATNLGTGNLNAGVATLGVSSLVSGSHSLTASYGGSGTHAGSTSSATSHAVRQATTTALASSPNPSTPNESVTLTATVSGAGGTPSGSVEFRSGATVLGSGTLNGSGVATFEATDLAAGVHSLTAVYPGDSTFAASTSAAVEHIAKGSSAITLTASATTVTEGQPLTLTATVTVDASPATTGDVEFFDDMTSLGVVAVNGSGVAALTLSSLSVGSHSFTASYQGTSASTSVTSAPVIASIEPADAAPPEAEEETPAGGCGCASTGSNPMLFALLGLGLVLKARRRRTA